MPWSEAEERGLGEAQALAQRDYPADKVCFLHTCKLSNEPKSKNKKPLS